MELKAAQLKIQLTLAQVGEQELCTYSKCPRYTSTGLSIMRNLKCIHSIVRGEPRPCTAVTDVCFLFWCVMNHLQILKHEAGDESFTDFPNI